MPAPHEPQVVGSAITARGDIARHTSNPGNGWSSLAVGIRRGARPSPARIALTRPGVLRAEIAWTDVRGHSWRSRGIEEIILDGCKRSRARRTTGFFTGPTSSVALDWACGWRLVLEHG